MSLAQLRSPGRFETAAAEGSADRRVEGPDARARLEMVERAFGAVGEPSHGQYAGWLKLVIVVGGCTSAWALVGGCVIAAIRLSR